MIDFEAVIKLIIENFEGLKIIFCHVHKIIIFYL